MQWVDSGISVWFFPRSAIPSDISAGAPLPDGWGKPMASWPATDCEPSKFFNSHSAIFDTTLWCVLPELSCVRAGLTDRLTGGRSGDWAGSVWGDAGSPGQAQSCAQRTGVSTCEDFVLNQGSAFSDACACSLFPPSCSQD